MIDKIAPALYLGSYEDASNLDTMKSAAVTHILTVGDAFLKPVFPDQFTYKTYVLDDAENADLLSLLPEITSTIDMWISTEARVLVHCHSGISRSSSVCIAYLMRYYKTPYYHAYETVRQARRCILPNAGFRRQLLQWETEKSLETREKNRAFNDKLAQHMSFFLFSPQDQRGRAPTAAQKIRRHFFAALPGDSALFA